MLLWVMWPATAMLVTSGLAALVMRWGILVKTFRNLSTAGAGAETFPLKWVGVGVLITSVALIVTQKVSLGLEIWMTVVAILLSLPLMLVGLRVLGETNWGPISAMSNMMQGIFGVLAPGHILANMLESGTTGTIATESEALMQDYKAGHMIGSSPKEEKLLWILGLFVANLSVHVSPPAPSCTAIIATHRAQARRSSACGSGGHGKTAGCPASHFCGSNSGCRAGR